MCLSPPSAWQRLLMTGATDTQTVPAAPPTQMAVSGATTRNACQPTATAAWLVLEGEWWWTERCCFIITRLPCIRTVKSSPFHIRAFRKHAGNPCLSRCQLSLSFLVQICQCRLPFESSNFYFFPWRRLGRFLQSWFKIKGFIAVNAVFSADGDRTIGTYRNHFQGVLVSSGVV